MSNRGLRLCCAVCVPMAMLPGGVRADCSVPTSVSDSAYNHVHELFYTTNPNETQSLDMIVPTKSVGPPPVVVWVHGGSFVGGHHHDGLQFGRVLSTFGIATALVGYRLTTNTANRFPAAISDVRCAASWVRANAAALGVDGTRFAVLGQSAGGNLAALLGMGANPGGRFDATRDCAVPYNVPVFSSIGDYYGTNEMANPTALTPLKITKLTKYLGVSPLDDPALAAEASPISYVNASNPPFLIARGTLDTSQPGQQATDMVVALSNAGVPVSYFDIQGLGHGFGPFGVGRSPELEPSACALVGLFQAGFAKAAAR